MDTIMSRTLLYIEDNAANLRLMQKIIATLPGLKLIDACTAEAGLAQAATHIPDLILMDINLPGMNGFAALRRLREDPATRHIPIIAVSANAMQRDIDRARAAGFDDYLTKPFEIPKLKEIVNSSLAR